MNNIKMYVIRDVKYPQWYFQHIKDYSSMMGYLAKNHPRYTHKFTTDIKQAMHFKTPNEVLSKGLSLRTRIKKELARWLLSIWVRITVKLSRTSME